MRFSLSTAVLVALAADSAVASTSVGKAAYNKWHETELERWLSDHNVPFPKAADRKELSDLVQKNWDDNVARPYNTWDTNQLSSYLTSKGQQIQKGTEKNKNSLIEQVQAAWASTGNQASDAYGSVQSYIFDTWTESQLKAFLDYHHIPNPSPNTRDSLLSTARSNYAKIAEKAGETASYPGDWLYTSWSESDLKSWLDERGIPAPQGSTRDKLIASMRRNAYVAANHASDTLASATNSAASAQQSLSDQLIGSWDDTKLKQWLDGNGIKVPQGSKRNELMALARKYRASLTGDNVSASAASAYGAATSSAGNQYAQATDGLYGQAMSWYNWALAQAGMGTEEAKSSLSSAGVRASSSASSLSGQVTNSAASAAAEASKSAASLSGPAAKSASSSMSSLSSLAAKSSSSLSSAAASSSSSLSSAAAKSASSASKQAASSSSSAKSRAKNEL